MFVSIKSNEFDVTNNAHRADSTNTGIFHDYLQIVFGGNENPQMIRFLADFIPEMKLVYNAGFCS